MINMIGLLYSVFKLRIGFAIMLCALAGIAVAPGPAPSAWATMLLAFAVLVSSAAAGAFNHYVERDLDARMARTRGRPFVTGRFAPAWQWPAGIGLLLAAAVGLAVYAANPVSAVFIFLGAFVYGVVYTVWLKRRTWWNIVIGGLAGSFAVLAGAAAVNPAPGVVPMILALVLFLWTPPHFWSLAFAYKDDYAAAGVPMLPVVMGEAKAAQIILVHTLALVGLSLLPFFFGLGWIYLTGAAVGGLLFVRASIALARRPERETAMRNFHASLAQLGLLLVSAMLDAGARAWLL